MNINSKKKKTSWARFWLLWRCGAVRDVELNKPAALLVRETQALLTDLRHQCIYRQTKSWNGAIVPLRCLELHSLLTLLVLVSSCAEQYSTPLRHWDAVSALPSGSSDCASAIICRTIFHINSPLRCWKGRTGLPVEFMLQSSCVATGWDSWPVREEIVVKSTLRIVSSLTVAPPA